MIHPESINFTTNFNTTMLNLFRKKSKKNSIPQLSDLNGRQILEGDTVKSLRYELGDCTVILEGKEYFYESLESKKRISYVKMVDAITGNQKVIKKE